MGWFDELIKERKKKNQEIFESSFNNLSTTVFKGKGESYDPMRIALEKIYRFYHIDIVEAPRKINVPQSDLDVALSKHNLRTRTIPLNENWTHENTEPILAFTLENHVPIVLLPWGKSYCYVHPKTRKRMPVDDYVQSNLEPEAITFYRPLAKKMMGAEDYRRYIFKSIRIRDLVFIVILTVLATTLGMASPPLSRILLGQVIDDVDYNLFMVIGLTMSGFAIAALLIKTVQVFVNNRVAIKTETSMHSAAMMHLLSLPPSFFKKHNTGELNSRLNSIPTLCNLIINQIFIGGLSAVLSLLYLIQIGGLSSALILPSVGVVVINMAFMSVVVVIERKVMKRQMILAAKETGVAYDLINGIQKIRLTGAEKRAFAKWADTYTASARAAYNPPSIMKLAPAITALIAGAGTVLIYYVAAINNLDKGSFAAFNSAYGSLSASIVAFSTILNNVCKVGPLMQMIAPIIEEESEVKQEKKQLESIEGNIKLDHLRFRYGEEEPWVLNDLSLDIKKGEYVAIVGKTGCGKSTIVRLLLGFEKPTEGHIYYDDNDLEELDLPSLRRKIGSVTQNGSLFHADIYHNIVISAPELTEKDAWAAAKVAKIDEDIRHMPMGMHTMISEGSGSISGGQKQRIMIARAIVHKPRVLIFDEATSALDNRCQKEVTEAIGKLECTRIVIAHRLSTIKECDRILYLERGKVVESGTYEELLALNGRFKELIERQKID